MNSRLLRIPSFVLIGLLLPACGGKGSGTLNPTVAPGIPFNVQAMPGNRSAKLTWQGTAIGSSFEVHRSVNPGGPFFPVSTPAGFITPTTYEDTGLVNGTRYYFQVVESNRFGSSPPSLVASTIPDFKALRLACKYGDNLALMPDSGVWRWGNGASVPVRVDKLPDITALASGVHSLALAGNGTVWGWGPNQHGELGAGTPPEGSTDPVQIPGITDAIAISAARGYSMAILHDGRVVVWGSNSAGQFGLGSNVPASSPDPQVVPGLTNIIEVSAGESHCMALRSDGLVFTWGVNQLGALGNPPTSAAVTAPAMVTDLSGIVAIAAGLNHSMSLRSDGTVWGWGYNYFGMVGNGTSNTPVVTPVQVVNLTGVVAIAATSGHSAAVRIDGTVWTWGSNDSGELGNGTAGLTPELSPIQVPGITDAVAVETSDGNTYALGKDGTVYAWGDNSGGQLGNQPGLTSAIPVELPNFNTVAEAKGGWDFSLVLKTNGTVWGFGTNTGGQLGNGDFADAVPVAVQTGLPSGAVAVSIAAGWYHGLALLSTGDVYGWGYNGLGPVGDGTSNTDYLSPVPLPALANVTTLACGTEHSLCIRNDVNHPRTVYTWGDNSWGQLGNGSFGGIGPTPTEIPGLTDVIAIAASERHSLAVKSDGSVWAWGDNNFYELGLGPGGPGSSPSPVQVPGISGAVAVSAGQLFSVVLCQDGTVWAWGVNGSAQLGVPSIPYSDTPLQVSGVAGAVSISSGWEFTLALLGNGTAVGWGTNSFYQLGNATAGNYVYTPVPVQELSGAISISTGMNHSMARMSNGTLHSWGIAAQGQLGVAPVTSSTIPVIITR
jgi:alpha-tubulin suppressor-like RCC1 family protein